jgi:mannan endo-1,4-beta-mannosidase
VGVSGYNFNLYQVNTTEKLTGHVPAILGCDYSNGLGQAIPPQKLLNYSCNEFLKTHWNKRGLIEIINHLSNPVSPNGGCLKNRSTLVFTDLLKPETETGQRWKSYIDIVAEGLNDLQQANVTVLYRPFHEMNGGWFWWGKQVSIDIEFFHSLSSCFRIQLTLKLFGCRYLIIFVMKRIYIIFYGSMHQIKVLQM